MAELDAPKVGSVWRFKGEVAAPGARLARVKVMAVAQGYVMSRRTGCMPFVTAVKDWPSEFAPVRALQANAREEATTSAAKEDAHG